MALTSTGKLYGWGAAACGQLGTDNSKPLPKDSEGSPYQPIPNIINALSKKVIVSVSCGEVLIFNYSVIRHILLHLMRMESFIVLGQMAVVN